MKLSDLKLDTYTIESDYSNCGTYSRVVYFDSVEKRYIKIWNEDYFYKKYFDLVQARGRFFSGISLLEHIIKDESGCTRGYTTPEAKPISFSNLDRNKYRDLIDRVATNSENNQVVYLDLKPSNVVEKDNIYYLIDLEPAIPVNYLDQIKDINYILQHNDYFYLTKIKNLLSKDAPVSPSFSITRQQTSWDKEIKYGTANGRIYLEKEYLPTLKGKTLFVGVNYYTNFYHLLTQSPEEFETLDCVEQRIEDGSPNIHYVCNVLDFQNQGYLYDNVCCFGVLGHNDDWEVIRNKEEVIKCITLLDAQVKPGGTLLLGPANQAFPFDWWDEIYRLPLFQKYTQLMMKKIDINYVWYGRKNG